MFCFACASACGQLTLLQGQTYTYAFDSFVFRSVDPIGVITGNTNYYGAMNVYVDDSTFQSGEQLRYEMFENSVAEAPICSGTLMLPLPVTGYGRCVALEAWSDHQGAIRLTMVSGSVTIPWLSLSSVTRWNTENALYSDTYFAPVPEPGTLAMFVCAAVAIGLWRLFKGG